MQPATWYNAERVKQPGSVVLARALPVLAEVNARRRADRAADVYAQGENAVRTGLSAQQLAELLGASGTTASGVAVTPDTAGRVSAVYACVSLLAGAVAGLPLAIYERSGESRKKASHDLWWIFNEQADTDWTASAAWEYLIAARFFYGDGLARILRASPYSNRIVGWRPLHPTSVDPFRAKEDGRRYYRVTEGSKVEVLDAADIIHIPSLGYDGLRSPSPITYAAREAVGTALAAEEYTARFYAQGATFDYALRTDSALNEEQTKILTASLKAKYSGVGTSRLPLILTGGLQVEPLSITPQDAALLPTRLFTVEEICRVFGVPPHMVGHTEKATSWGTGLAEQGSNFVRYSLRRHLVAIAQEINRKFWPTRERYFVEHVTAALESGDLKSRSDAYRVALGRAGEPAWMTVNEVRRLENMPPVDGGDTLPAPSGGTTGSAPGGAGTPAQEPAS